jgi:hypothetical protein
MFLWIAFPGEDFGREVFHPNNLVIWEQQFTHPVNVEPFVGSVFDRPVIEIEPIHVDDGFHDLPSVKKAEAVLPASRPVSKDRGECKFIIAEILADFNRFLHSISTTRRIRIAAITIVALDFAIFAVNI